MLVTLAGRVDQWAKGPSLSATARAVAAENLTYLSPAKMLRLASAVTRSLKSGVSGDVVEFGIALGGSAIVLAKHARRHGRRFHGFDVGGLYREVCETFARYDIAVDDLAVKLHKGLFEDTLPALHSPMWIATGTIP
jgi:O-methyltransferase